MLLKADDGKPTSRWVEMTCLVCGMGVPSCIVRRTGSWLMHVLQVPFLGNGTLNANQTCGCKALLPLCFDSRSQEDKRRNGRPPERQRNNRPQTQNPTRWPKPPKLLLETPLCTPKAQRIPGPRSATRPQQLSLKLRSLQQPKL